MALFGNPGTQEKLEPATPGEERGIALEREELVVALDPHSSAAEQFRRLRNSLQALNPDGASRSILLTSAVAGEGKTVAALNLALALVELPGLRVIVVDADRQKPSVENFLGFPRRAGVSELLEGELTVDQAIRQTAVERLDFIGAGATSRSTVVQLERLQALLNALKRRYDYVLIDGPAVLTANHPSLLGSIADGILLVVRLGSTPKFLVEEAYQMLENLGGNVLGTCATNVEGG